MTKQEALIATLDIEFKEKTVELALINAGINGSDNYSKENQEEIERCAVPLLFTLFTRPDVSEGGFSVSHPDFLRKVKEPLLLFAKKYGMTDILEQIQDPKPTVTGKSVW